MRFDILANYDNLIFVNKETNSFVTNLEEITLSKIAYAVDSLVKFNDKVSLLNIKIITEIPTDELEDFISFILQCEDAAVLKYKD
jgi:hypothetical protein